MTFSLTYDIILENVTKEGIEMKKSNGFGTASLVLGIIGLIFSIIIIGVIPAIIGFVLGIVGICQKDKVKGSAIAGTVCSAIGLLIFLAIAGSGDSSKKENNYSSSNDAVTVESKSEKKEAKLHSMGETAEMNGIQITMTDFTESSGTKYDKPESGNIFALAEFEVVNNTDEEITISSIGSFESYVDDYSVSQHSLASFYDIDSLDGTLAVGKRMKGWIGWEVPSDYQSIEVHFKKNFLMGESLDFLYER